MFLHEANQILRKLLLLFSRNLDNSNKIFSPCNFDEQLRVRAQLDTFQREVIVFIIVFCRRRRRHRPHCLRSLTSRR